MHHLDFLCCSDWGPWVHQLWHLHLQLRYYWLHKGYLTHQSPSYKMLSYPLMAFSKTLFSFYSQAKTNKHWRKQPLASNWPQRSSILSFLCYCFIALFWSTNNSKEPAITTTVNQYLWICRRRCWYFYHLYQLWSTFSNFTVIVLFV